MNQWWKDELFNKWCEINDFPRGKKVDSYLALLYKK